MDVSVNQGGQIGQPDGGNPSSTSQADWKSQLSPEFQNHPEVQKFSGKPLDELVKSHINAQSLIGKKTIEKEVIPDGLVKIPGADASKDDREAFFKAMGVPEKPEDYPVPDFSDLYESLPGGKDWKPDAKMEAWFRQQSVELGLTPEQFGKLYKGQIQFLAAEMKNIEKAQVDHLRSSYGDRYDTAIKEAQRAAGRLSPEMQQLISSQIGKDSVLTRVLQEIGAKFGESQSPDGAVPAVGANQQLEDLKKKRNEIRASNAFRNGNAKTPEVIQEGEILKQILAIEKGMGIRK